MVNSASYEPWGAPRVGSTTLGGFGHTGEQHDAETGFVYLRARHYDPATGRFLQPDSYPGTLADPASQHRYGYAGNNPALLTDPSGHDPWGRDRGEEEQARAICEWDGGHGGHGCDHLTRDEVRFLLWTEYVVNDHGGTLIDPTDPASAFRDGSHVDKAICAITSLGGGFAGIVWGGGKAAASGFRHAWIKRSLFAELPKLVGEADFKKFVTALGKGLVGPVGESGIKILSKPVGRYTHELKIGRSAQRLR